MNDHAHSTAGLTKNQSLVMGALAKADAPLSAYTILDQLRDDGFRAPLQVYRALDKLVESGLVHRLESMNAFVACTHPACDDHGITTFMICEQCNQVIEKTDSKLASDLKRLGSEANFTMKKAMIELRGLCSKCANQAQ